MHSLSFPNYDNLHVVLLAYYVDKSCIIIYDNRRSTHKMVNVREDNQLISHLILSRVDIAAIEKRTDVQRETGIAWSTLNSWANNQLTRYDAPVIKALCEYFDCQVGDLLVFEREDKLIQ